MTVRRLLIASGILALAVWLSAGALVCENGLRIQRQTAETSPADVRIEAADGAILIASFIRGTGNNGCVMLLHGISASRSNALGFAPMFLESGYSVLAPDSRAHGSSGGDLVTFGILERGDVLRWTAWMRTQGCQRIYGLGESLGASILIQAAAQEPVFSAIVAESPFRNLPTIAEYRLVQKFNGPKPLLRVLAKAIMPAALIYARVRYGLDLTAASPQNSAAHLTTPLLLIHGTADTNIPPQHSIAIATADPRAVLWLVPGATHTAASSKQPVEFRTRVLNWFDTR
jgi:pimeloyl-ACP methyl ester carboxylesterase